MLLVAKSKPRERRCAIIVCIQPQEKVSPAQEQLSSKQMKAYLIDLFAGVNLRITEDLALVEQTEDAVISDLRAIDERRTENVGMGQRKISEIICQGYWKIRGSPSKEIGLRHRNVVPLFAKKKRPSNLLFADEYEGELWKRELENVLLPMREKYEVVLVDDPDGLVHR